MRRLSIIAWMGVALLTGCGGSSKSITGESSTTSTGTTTASTITVTSSGATIPSDGSASVTITAVAKDSKNAAVSGATVTFAASAGNITVTQGTTDSTGTATATLATGSAAVGATITVTATSGAASGKVSVTVANTQKTLTLLTNLPQIPSDGSKSATISALVRDSNNNVVTGTTVSFVASSGVLTVTSPTTDASGTATATLGSAGDATNRIITVTATAGTATAKIAIPVGGTKLTLTGPLSLIQGSVGTYAVSLTDAGGNGVANQTVTLTSSAGNTLAPPTYVTDSTGQKTFTLSAVIAGNDTITAAAAGLQATQTVAVSNQSFTFTAPASNAKVNLGVSATVTVNWSSAGAPQVGKTVTFSATRGTLTAATALTDASGNASVAISSTTAGPSVISASATAVTAQSGIDFVATTPAALNAQASPASIGPLGTSTITVTVRDPANNLVEGQVVDFSITKDPTGGSLSVASATTDSQGQASTVYTATSTTSPKDGVVITAAIPGTAVSGATSLTVAGQTVFLSLGTGNTVVPYPVGATTTVQYELPYSVAAVDNAGHGVNAVQISLALTSLAYFKGQWLSASPWAYAPSTAQPPYTGTVVDPDAYRVSGIDGCKSEDVNNDGIYAAVNDYNANGKLDPGLVASTDVASVVTSNGGSANFNIIYPKDHAYWVAVRLTATATVAGTQSNTSADFLLPGLASDYANKATSPPGQFSPYGLGTTCKDKN